MKNVMAAGRLQFTSSCSIVQFVAGGMASSEDAKGYDPCTFASCAMSLQQTPGKDLLLSIFTPPPAEAENPGGRPHGILPKKPSLLTHQANVSYLPSGKFIFLRLESFGAPAANSIAGLFIAMLTFTHSVQTLTFNLEIWTAAKGDRLITSWKGMYSMARSA